MKCCLSFISPENRVQDVHGTCLGNEGYRDVDYTVTSLRPIFFSCLESVSENIVIPREATTSRAHLRRCPLSVGGVELSLSFLLHLDR